MTDQAVVERFDKAFGPCCWGIDDATLDRIIPAYIGNHQDLVVLRQR